jgi:Phasin protein
MVAAASRTQANAKSPIQSFFHVYFSGLETMSQAYDPFSKNIARAQLEFMGFMSRRAQAYLEIPNRLSACRTPQDFAHEQMRFWRTAYEEYAESVGRMTEAMASMASPSFGFGQHGDGVRNSHDYLAFPEGDERGRPVHPRERKAA